MTVDGGGGELPGDVFGVVVMPSLGLSVSVTTTAPVSARPRCPATASASSATTTSPQMDHILAASTSPVAPAQPAAISNEISWTNNGRKRRYTNEAMFCLQCIRRTTSRFSPVS